jgi:excisionase family DNA binding protein
MEKLTFNELPQAITQLYDKLSRIEQLLIEKNSESIQEADQLLTIQQVSEMLSLSVPTIYGLVSRAEIPCMKKSKRLYFSKEELIAWIKVGRKKTTSEIEAEANAFLLNKKKGIKS